MPEEQILLEQIDNLINTLSFKKGSHADVMLTFLRSHLKTDADCGDIRSIKTVEIIKEIWPKTTETEEEYKKILKAKRKSVSSVKSQINKQCRNLYWDEQNPARIGINRFNVFKPLRESKAEKVQKMQARIMYLEKLISDVAPSTSEELADVNPDLEQAVKQIRKSIDQRREHGMVMDSGGELILTEEEHKPDIPEDLLPEAKALFIAEDKIKYLLGQLEDLHSEKIQIEKKLEEGSITEAEAALRLKRIEAKKKSISEDAQQMIETSDISDLKPEDEELNKTLKELKHKLAAIADDENITTTLLNDIVQKGMEALEQIEKQKASDSENAEIKELFEELKTQAEELLKKTKPILKEIKPLSEKEKTITGLSHDEKKRLLEHEELIKDIQTEGSFLIKRLEKLKSKSDKTTQEAIVIIISGLANFLSIKPNKHKYIEDLQQEETETEFTEEMMPEAKTLFEAKEKITRLLAQMEDLYTERNIIAKKLKDDSISQEEADRHLTRIAQKQQMISGIAENMLKHSDIADITLEDSDLNEALNELKEKLVTLANDEAISTSSLSEILQNGIDALAEIEEQKASDSEKDDIKSTFETLKAAAKDLLLQTKPILEEIKPLSQKEQSPTGLSQEEKRILMTYENSVKLLQEKGSEIIEKLEELKPQSDKITQEAIILIISGLANFLRLKAKPYKYTEILEESFSEARAKKQIEEALSKERPTEEILPEAKELFEADDKINNLFSDMQDLHEEKISIEQKLKSGDISQDEADSALKVIRSKQESISTTAKNMIDSTDIEALETEDEKLNETLKELKQKLVTIADEADIKTDMLQDIIQKGLDALNEIEKQKASAEDTEEVKEEFSVLKARAKTLLKEIKPLYKEVEELSKKEQTLAGLSQEEKKSLLSFETSIRALQQEGKTLIQKLKVLEKECDPVTKEAVIIIISSLERFLSIEPEKRRYAEVTEAVPTDEERGSSPEFLKTLKEEKEQELDQLSEEYKEIKKKILDEHENIQDAREELNLLAQEKSSLAEEKLILKQMDTPLSNKGEEIINNIREKTRDFTKRLQDINEREQQIYTDIRNNVISEAEGAEKLAKLEEEKEKLIEASAKFEEYLSESQKDSSEDPAVMTLLDRIKNKLKNMQSSHKNLDLKMMESMLSKGLEALEDLEKKEKELDDAEKQETEEDIKKEFIELKTKAKEILKTFKKTYPETQTLIEKEKSEVNLTPEEQQTLQGNRKTISSLRKLGEQTLEKLEILETKTTGPMLEAIVLIKTTLAKFINQDDIKKRLLAKADKSKQTESALKSEEGLMQEMLKAKTKIDETHTKIKQTEQEIANLEKIYDDLKTELKRKQMVLDEAENKASSLEKRKSELLDKINELNIDVAASERMIQMHQNQKLMDVANKFRHQLSDILDQKELDEEKLDELIDKGLDAIKEAAGTDDPTENNAKEQFIELKDKAKTMLKTFKEIGKLKKTGAVPDDMLLKESETKKEAKALAEDINNFIDSTSGPLREAAVLILSSLKRYIGEIEISSAASGTQSSSSTGEGTVQTEIKERIVERGSGIRSYFKETFSTEEEALSDFNKADKADGAEKEASPEAKKKFAEIKADAKDLIDKFRKINRTLTKIEVAKKESGGTLPDKDEKELQFYYVRRNHLQEEGKNIIADLENFKQQEGTAFKEPITLIISSLKKFISDIAEIMLAESSQNIVKEKINLPSGYKLQTDEMEEKEIGRLNQDLTRMILRLKENLPVPQQEPLEKSSTSAKSFLEDLNLTLEHFEIGANHVDSSLVEKGIFHLKESLSNLNNNNLDAAAQSIRDCISSFEKTSLDIAGFMHVKQQEATEAEEKNEGAQVKNIIHLGGDEDQVTINNSFLIDRFPVTIGQFKKFVDDTGYKTKAEKDGYGWVYKKRGMLVSSSTQSKVLTLQGTPSLSKIAGACWYNPEGIPLTSIDLISLSDWPAVHITYYDARAYATWVQKRLPTKEEWMETTGMKENYDLYPWGSNPDVSKCNNKKANFTSLSPVQIFPPNDYEVFDLIGNCWEWCENAENSQKFICGGCWNMDLEEMKHPAIAKMGAANTNNTIGFRCVKDL